MREGCRMKKIIYCIFVCVFIFCLSACTEKARLQRELKEAQEAASATGDLAEEAQEDYDRVTELFDEYDKLTEQLESLPKGSEEYQAILSLRNALVRMMIDEYPDLAQYVTGE